MLLLMHRHHCKGTWIMKNQANVTVPKKSNKSLVTDPKEIESYNLPDKTIKITKRNSMKCENYIQKTNKIRKIMHEQNENFNFKNHIKN